MRIFYQSPVAHNWIRQRPQEIAEGLAKCEHQVFWFYAGNFLKTRFRRFDDGNGFSGLELPVLPFASRCRPLEWLNRLWCSWWLRHLEVDVVIATNPVALPWLPRKLLSAKFIYDCMDVQTAFFTGRRRRRMVEAERALVKDAAQIIASSKRIRECLISDYQAESSKIAIIPNGITPKQKHQLRPVVETHHPSIAYFGTIAPWFDWSGVQSAATLHPDWSFDLFGPSDVCCDPYPVNVHVHGPISHEQVWAQAMACDVLIMPFVRSELIEGVDPVKMYEYLQTGRPVVSSWWPLLEKFKPFPAVHFYDTASSLATQVEVCLHGPREYPIPVEFLKANAWSRRIVAFDQVIKAAIGESR